MADVPKKGGDPVSIWLEGAKQLFGLARNTPTAPGPDRVLKDQGKWSDPVAVQAMRDAVENKPLPTTGKPGAIEVLRRARDYNLGVLDKRLAELEPGEYDGPEFDLPTPEYFPAYDQDLSPVFGGAVAGINMAGASEDLKRRVAKDLADKAKAAKMKAAKARPFKLPKSTGEKVLDAAAKLLKKVPKSLLPDAELVQIGVKIGKALRGATWPVAVQTVGTIAIEKAAKVAKRVQFENMTKILGPQDAAAYQLRKKMAKGPPTRKPPGAVRNDPTRPAPPKPGVVPKVATVARAKPIKTPSPITVRLAKRPVPLAPVSSAIGQPLPTAPLRKSINVSQLAGLLPKALLAQRKRGSGSASGFPAAELRPQPQPALMQRFSAAPTTVGEKVCRCYTKKTGPRKKRKSPRICVTPAAARKAGLLN